MRKRRPRKPLSDLEFWFIILSMTAFLIAMLCRAITWAMSLTL